MIRKILLHRNLRIFIKFINIYIYVIKSQEFSRPSNVLKWNSGQWVRRWRVKWQVAACKTSAILKAVCFLSISFIRLCCFRNFPHANCDINIDYSLHETNIRHYLQIFSHKTKTKISLEKLLIFWKYFAISHRAI